MPTKAKPVDDPYEFALFRLRALKRSDEMWRAAESRGYLLGTCYGYSALAILNGQPWHAISGILLWIFLAWWTKRSKHKWNKHRWSRTGVVTYRELYDLPEEKNRNRSA